MVAGLFDLSTSPHAERCAAADVSLQDAPSATPAVVEEGWGSGSDEDRFLGRNTGRSGPRHLVNTEGCRELFGDIVVEDVSAHSQKWCASCCGYALALMATMVAVRP